MKVCLRYYARACVCHLILESVGLMLKGCSLWCRSGKSEVGFDIAALCAGLQALRKLACDCGADCISTARSKSGLQDGVESCFLHADRGL